MTQTDNYSLSKVENSDLFSSFVSSFNSNMETLDTKVKEIADALPTSSSTGPATQTIVSIYLTDTMGISNATIGTETVYGPALAQRIDAGEIMAAAICMGPGQNIFFNDVQYANNLQSVGFSGLAVLNGYLMYIVGWLHSDSYELEAHPICAIGG